MYRPYKLLTEFTLAFGSDPSGFSEFMARLVLFGLLDILLLFNLYDHTQNEEFSTSSEAFL